MKKNQLPFQGDRNLRLEDTSDPSLLVSFCSEEWVSIGFGIDVIGLPVCERGDHQVFVAQY